MDMNDIKKVTPVMLRQIIDTRQPLGLFYAQEDSGYTGVDNHDGHAWTEAFPDLRRCKRWLLNPEVEAENGEDLGKLFRALRAGVISIDTISEELSYREMSNQKWDDYLYEYTTEELAKIEACHAIRGAKAFAAFYNSK